MFITELPQLRRSLRSIASSELPMAASSRGARQQSFKARRNRSHLKTNKTTTVARQLRGKKRCCSIASSVARRSPLRRRR